MNRSEQVTGRERDSVASVWGGQRDEGETHYRSLPVPISGERGLRLHHQQTPLTGAPLALLYKRKCVRQWFCTLPQTAGICGMAENLFCQRQVKIEGKVRGRTAASVLRSSFCDLCVLCGNNLLLVSRLSVSKFSVSKFSVSYET